MIVILKFDETINGKLSKYQVLHFKYTKLRDLHIDVQTSSATILED